MALFTRLSAAQALILATPAMLNEFSQVLSRPQFKLSAAQQSALTAQQRARISLCPPAADCRLPCTDPADQMFIDLAAAQRAEALLSRDKALLRLRRAAARRFGLHISLPHLYEPSPCPLANRAAHPLPITQEPQP